MITRPALLLLASLCALAPGCMAIPDDAYQQALDPDHDDVLWGPDGDCDNHASAIGDAASQPVYIDQDGDGYGETATETTLAGCPDPATLALQDPPLTLDDGDCDDNNPAIYPGAPEQCNGIDDNCDENAIDSQGTCQPGADVTLSTASTAARPSDHTLALAGSALAILRTEAGAARRVAIGAPGMGGGSPAIYLLDLPWPAGSTTMSTGNSLRVGSTADGSRFGSALTTVEDQDGDGVEELVVAAPRLPSENGTVDGAVWLMGSATLDSEALSQVAGEALAGMSGDLLGYALATTCGDGVAPCNDTLLLGAPGWAGEGAARGAVYAVDAAQLWSATATSGDTGDTPSLSELDPGTISGASDQDRLGTAIAAGTDIDGNGVPDLLLGTGGTPGRAWLVLDGVATQTLSVVDADQILYSDDEDDDGLGAAVALVPDVDGDGTADLLLGAPNADTSGGGGGGREAGKVYLVLGGPAVLGSADLTRSYARFAGADAGGHLGATLAAAGDLDSDGASGLLGRNDLALGAPEAGADSSASGAIYLVFGPVELGPHDISDTSVASRVVGRTPGDHAGSALLAIDDQTGEGNPDLLIAAPWEGAGDGAVYLFGVGL